MRCVAESLAALYLPGGSPLSPRRWPVVAAEVRRAGSALGAVRALAVAGYSSESLLLGEPGRVAAACEALDSASVLTAACPGYPPLWLERLGAAAPPVVRGRPCGPGLLGFEPGRPVVAVVGSRHPSPAGRAFAVAVASVATSLGAVVVSGGAIGIDSAAARSASSVVEILPHGSLVPRVGRGGVPPSAAARSLLSPFAAGAEFTAAQAMQRNVLIYASAALAVVIEPRYGVGGTWHGAREAMRRRLCPVAIFHGPESGRAEAALQALGALPIRAPGDLAALLAAGLPQPRLFTAVG
ncbi:MAG: DNA-processing protein DprA [Fimbriimonadaceae bacterium]